jgi:hypothetical protein
MFTRRVVVWRSQGTGVPSQSGNYTRGYKGGKFNFRPLAVLWSPRPYNRVDLLLIGECHRRSKGLRPFDGVWTGTHKL